MLRRSKKIDATLPQVFGPLTKLQCCPTSDGSGAAILASEDFVRKHGLQSKAVEIAGMAMMTDTPASFEEKSCIKMVGFDMTKGAAQKVYEQSGGYRMLAKALKEYSREELVELVKNSGLRGRGGACQQREGTQQGRNGSFHVGHVHQAYRKIV